MTSARPLALLVVASLSWIACTSHANLYPIEGSGGGLTTTITAAGGAGGATSSSSGGSGGSTTTTTSASSTVSSGGSGGSTTTASASGGGGSGGSASSSSSGSSSSSSGGLSGTRVRIAAANLTSGNAQSYDPGHGVHILQGIHADLVLMQEMNYGANTTTSLQALVDAVCGTQCVYVRGSGTIPNGVISRYPIVASGSWVDPKVANRDFTWARIDVPGPTDLWAVSIHLLTSNPTDRDAEAAALNALLQANVPATDLLVVGGDLNTDNRSEPVIATLGARLSIAAPYPADGDGNDNTSGPRTRPYDWTLASPELRLLETPVVIGASSFASGLVVDTRVYTPIADLAPALAGDSGAQGMQHMAVVRDFLLQ